MSKSETTGTRFDPSLNDGICQMCGVEKSARAHRSILNDDIAGARPDQLLMVCEACHGFAAFLRAFAEGNATTKEEQEAFVRELIGSGPVIMATPEFRDHVHASQRAAFLRAVERN